MPHPTTAAIVAYFILVALGILVHVLDRIQKSVSPVLPTILLSVPLIYVLLSTVEKFWAHILWQAISVTVHSTFSTSFGAIFRDIAAGLYVLGRRIGSRGGKAAVRERWTAVKDFVHAVVGAFILTIIYHTLITVPTRIRSEATNTAYPLVAWSDRLPKATLAIRAKKTGGGSGQLGWGGFYEIPDSFAVTLGNITSEITMSDLRKWGQMIPIRTGGAVPIVVKPGKNGNILFSFTAWAGGPVAIENNKVLISNPMIDRNFSNNALEIVDSNGQPVFQMIRENASHITIYGIFSTSQGLLCFDRNDPLEFGGYCADGFKLTPIFRYPAWKYPGEYAASTPSRHIPSDSEVILAAHTVGSVIGSITVIPASSADDIGAIAQQLCAFAREAKWSLMCARSQASVPTPPNIRGIQCYAANWNSTDAVLFQLAMHIMRVKCADQINHQFSYGGYTASGITVLIGSPQ